MVEVTNPPITTVASGRRTSEPVPDESINGTSPSAVVIAVNNTGRSLRRAPRIDSRLNDSREVICHLEQLDREVLPLLGREYDGERRRRLRDNIEPHRFQITARKGVVRVGNRSAPSGLPSKR
jgi:hypothetical protein